MSLKDPLSYMRLVRPIRSTRCSHLQCFEAKWWIIGNEKHPQWLCPLCNRALRFDELIVDGYSLDILDVVPEKYDEVVIEADNAWHTEDGAYGSASWLRLNAASAKATREPTPKNEDEEQDTKPDQFRLSTSPDPKGKRKAIEILSSDDEDYEQPLAKTTNNNLRPPAINTTASDSHSAAPTPSSRPPSAQPPPVSGGGVIDLTLSDSDDDVEDAVTNFDRSNDRTQLVPSSSSGPRPPSVDPRTNANGHTNGSNSSNGNGTRPPGHHPLGDSTRPGSSSNPATTTTSARAQPVHRYVPPYMANPHDTFAYNPHKRPNASDRWRPGPGPASAAAVSGSGSGSGLGSAAAGAAGSDQDPDYADSERRRAALDELRRKRERERDRDRDRHRDRGMDTDSDDDEYRYRR